MPWVPWIETVTEEGASEEVKALYDRARNPRTGQTRDYVRLTSLTPPVARLLFDLSQAVHEGARGLSRREQEVVALVVSAFNG